MSRTMVDFSLNLPPGFRFHPTDDELVKEYLIRKCEGQPLAASVIAEVDLYRLDPWDLPEMATYGEKEWYFFSPRDRKYPNGMRPNRAARTGYWKATGADKHIGQPKTLGIKKGLAFYLGKSPEGIKTNWIMHEYRLANVDRSPTGKKNQMRLDDWVLCRVYNKKGYIEKYTVTEPSALQAQEMEENKKPGVSLSISKQPMNKLSENRDAHMVEILESVPKLQPELSGSDHVNAPECNKEVQSESLWEDFENNLEKGFEFSMEGLLDDNEIFSTQPQQQENQFSPLQEMFSFNQKQNTQRELF